MEVMHKIIILESEQFGNIRVFVEEGESKLWFVAIDICRALDIDPTATRRLDEDEKIILRLTHTSPNGTFEERKLACVSESGLYALVLGSSKPEAKTFKSWITQKVSAISKSLGGGEWCAMLL
jgi:prophage antirepressor-like protein